jgi:hypothetical protein
MGQCLRWPGPLVSSANRLEVCLSEQDVVQVVGRRQSLDQDFDRMIRQRVLVLLHPESTSSRMVVR